MSVTLKDIARIARVDAGAVSRTLRDHPDSHRLSLSTRQRICEVASALGYHPNLLASATRTGKVNTIAVIGGFQDRMSSYISLSITGILAECSCQNYNLKLFSDRCLSSVLPTLLGLQIKHVISLSHQFALRKEVSDFCSSHGLRLIYLYEQPHSEFPTVTVDNRLGLEKAVMHLAGLGHQRIGLLCAPHCYLYHEERHAGFLSGMSKCGLAVDDQWISCSDDTEAAVDRMLDLGEGRRPTALCTISDQQALLVQRCVLRRGWHLPGDLSVIGFGNLEVSEFAAVSLSSIEESLVLRGHLAMKLLLGEKIPEIRFQDGFYFVDPFLVLRSSTAPPK